MRMIIVRHGESEADILNVCEGRADFPLTARGHRQAEALAARLAREYKIGRIVASPLTRARQTAASVAAACGLPAALDDDLMEFNNGLVAGVDKARAGELFSRVPDVPIHAAAYEQESLLEFRFRAERALSRIMFETPAAETVAVVSHGGMINQLFRAFLRLPVDADIRFASGDTGLHEWTVEDGTRRIVRVNSLSHAKGI